MISVRVDGLDRIQVRMVAGFAATTGRDFVLMDGSYGVPETSVNLN